MINQMTSEPYKNFAEFLWEVSMSGDGTPYSNLSGECWTVIGKRVLYSNDWGALEVLTFKNENEASRYAHSEAGPDEWSEDIEITTDLLRDNDSESVWVAVYHDSPSRSTLCAVSKDNDEAFSLAVRSWCESAQYWPDLWNDSGQLLTVDPDGIHFATLPEPVR